MRILVAEDDLQISKLLVMTLEKIGGHKVTMVHNGEMALHLAMSMQFDVILLDEQMPVKNGIKVAQEYNQKCPNGTPIIFLSGKSDPDSFNKFLKLGVGYIQKPFLPGTLCEQILTILSKKSKVPA